MKNDLKEDWLDISLVKDLNYVKTGVEEYAEYKKYYSTGSIKNDSFKAEGSFSYSQRPSRANRIGKLGDVIQARMKGTDKAVLIDKNLDKELFSTGFFQVRPNPNTLISKYLFYYFKSYLFLNEKDKNCSGSTQSALNDKSAQKLCIPLSPIPIQREIVKKIEELFSSLDNGIDDLIKSQEQLKIYRQAVLNDAFSSKAKSLKTIKDIVEKVQIGPFGSQLHKSDYILNGIPLINPMHIQSGKLKPNPKYSISKLKRDSLPNYILKEGDVIVGRRGEMGRSALITKKEIGWFCGTGSLYLRPDVSKILPRYLNKYIQSPTVKLLLTGSAAGTTMMNLNKKIVSTLPIPVPSLNQQHQIVQEIESRLSVCDAVEQNIKDSLEKALALRQSILKKAFEGKLLSQEEIAACKQHKDYEPASVLLEKIKAEKKQK